MKPKHEIVELLKKILHTTDSTQYAKQLKKLFHQRVDYEAFAAALKEIFHRLEFEPVAIIREFQGLLAVMNKKWLEQRLEKLMYPTATPLQLKEFMTLVGKQLLYQEKQRDRVYKNNLYDKI